LIDVIRKATIKDLSEVHDIESVSFKDPYPRGFLKALFQIYPETSLVALKNERVIGYIIASSDRGDGHLISIAVHPLERRQNVGEALIKTLLAILHKQRVTLLRLEVRKSNEVAQMFYKKLGFEFSHVIPQYYYDEDGWVFYKTVEKAVS
jgi:ribosomal-protein-alanine N-acetyltransferase